jgi:diguanylate cyclase (GGDEF)-like protein
MHPGFFGLPNLVSLLIEAIGALLIATLCFLLQQTVRRVPLVYWTAGWLSLSASLLGLLLAFDVPRFTRIGEAVYIFGEYLFGYLVFAGCRLYTSASRPSRAELWLAVPALVLAVYLSALGAGDFNVLFTVHTLIYACLFFAAYRELRSARPAGAGRNGLRVMKAALLLLTIDYAHYAPLFAAALAGVVLAPLPYLVYSPLYDLIFLVLLGFGMVMVMTGVVQQELETANTSLAKARDRLQVLVQRDHLTSALNRHGFYSFLQDSRTIERLTMHGCVAVADIDNLKTINDRYGHASGDAAIRAVAAGIRACIRADDLLFRWGGDEFLILLIGVSETDARDRFESLNHSLKQIIIAGVPEAVDVSVSIGYAALEASASLDEVIALADAAMYEEKRATG